MEKEFIPYEQALALKELGFNESCYSNYNNLTDKTRLIFGKTNEGCITVNKVPGTDKIVTSNERILAPLYQQAFRWFREKYNLWHEINRLIQHINTEKEFLAIAVGVQENEWGSDYSKSYEEAELECLKKLIEMVKEK